MIDLLKRTRLYPFAQAARHRWTYRRPARFYSQFFGAGDLCFDVGANSGDRTSIFLHMGATVVAVEPQPGLVNVLKHRFPAPNRLHIVPEAVGAAPGEAELRLAESSVLATLSTGWIDAVKESRRFPGMEWSNTLKVSVTTLDRLIEIHGKPRFIKIDVEGYEVQALDGLSSSVAALSFEFTAEIIDNADQCVRRLASLGFREFSYSPGESLELAGGWVDADQILRSLHDLPDRLPWGDVYARA